jgi:hypothetical protein
MTSMAGSPALPETMPAEDIDHHCPVDRLIEYSITYHLDGGTNHDEANPDQVHH